MLNTGKDAAPVSAIECLVNDSADFNIDSVPTAGSCSLSGPAVPGRGSDREYQDQDGNARAERTPDLLDKDCLRHFAILRVGI